jgi:hypothetical protein
MPAEERIEFVNAEGGEVDALERWGRMPRARRAEWSRGLLDFPPSSRRSGVAA